MFVVFDLDGTLSCAKHRHHHIEKFDLECGEPGPVDWDTFYRLCAEDPPILPIVNVLRALHDCGARIEIWSGRSDLVEAETREWFARHGVPYIPMRMRRHGDHQSDVTLKQAWLRACDSKPDLVFEDRARVVAMWRAEGVRVCQVDVGDF